MRGRAGTDSEVRAGDLLVVIGGRAGLRRLAEALAL
jgi:K+/H+ antiporter YhaU regulatory subunit KhtT